MDQQDFDKEVRRFVYDRMMTTGRAPAVAEVAVRLGKSEADVREVLERLAGARMVVLQESGEILMANPFSAVPTPFVVEANGRQYWGNCLWDALGVLAMLQADGRLVATCGDCNEAIAVEVRDGDLANPGVGLAHYVVPAAHWWDDIRYT